MRWRTFIALGLAAALAVATLPARSASAQGAGAGETGDQKGALPQPSVSVRPATARSEAEWVVVWVAPRKLLAEDRLILTLPPGTDVSAAAATVNGAAAALVDRRPFSIALPAGTDLTAPMRIQLTGVRNPAEGLYTLCIETSRHPEPACSRSLAVLPADVPAHSRAAGAIAFLYLADLLRGYTDGSFRPDAPMRRSEFAKLLTSALQFSLPAGMAAPVLSDVEEEDWFQPYAGAAVAGGLMDTDAAGRFRPLEPLSRAELAVALSRFLTRSATADWAERLQAANRWPDAARRFEDAAKVAFPDRDRVGLALGLGLVAPATRTRLDPGAAMARAEVAAALYKALVIQAQGLLLAGDNPAVTRHLEGPAAAACPLAGDRRPASAWGSALRGRLSPLRDSLIDLARQAAQLESWPGAGPDPDDGFWTGLREQGAAVGLDLTGVTVFLLTCTGPEVNPAEIGEALAGLAQLDGVLDWLDGWRPGERLADLIGEGGLLARLMDAAGGLGKAGWLLPDYSWWDEWTAAEQVDTLGKALRTLLEDVLGGNWGDLDADLDQARTDLEVLLLVVEMGGPAPPLYSEVALDLQELARETRRALEACGALRSSGGAKDPVAAVRYTLRALFALSRLTADLALAHLQEHLEQTQGG